MKDRDNDAQQKTPRVPSMTSAGPRDLDEEEVLPTSLDEDVPEDELDSGVDEVDDDIFLDYDEDERKRAA